MPDHRRSPLPLPVQLLLALSLAVALVYFGFRQRNEFALPAPGPTKSAAEKVPATESAAVVANVTIRNRDGQVVYRGDVDLAPTIARIKAGERLSQFRNDGATFQNREQRLPRQGIGHYREWVHPTPGLSGPGPQRIVTGKRGEFYYTPDHYETFRRLKVDLTERP
jgi:guanyl-specific ribonuclease Sa